MLRGRGRAGFTLLEITVAMVLVAVLAGVIYTQVIRRVGGGEAAALAQNLNNLSKAVYAFRGDVGRYPGRLTQLTAPLSSGALDSCGVPFPAAASWQGPYLDRVVTGAGIASGTATIRADLLRDPVSAGSSAFGTLLIQADGVDRAIADELDRAFDNGSDLASGTIRWSADAPTPTRGRLSYAVPIRGC